MELYHSARNRPQSLPFIGFLWNRREHPDTIPESLTVRDVACTEALVTEMCEQRSFQCFIVHFVDGFQIGDGCGGFVSKALGEVFERI